jgi:outer membrane protein OmpA-like peptidoglycan-associated protein
MILLLISGVSYSYAQKQEKSYKEKIDRLVNSFSYHKAIHKGERLLKRHRTDTGLLRSIANLAWRVRDFDQAIRYAHDLYTIHPTAASLQLYTQALMTREDYAGIIQLTKSFLAIHPDNDTAAAILQDLYAVPSIQKGFDQAKLRALPISPLQDMFSPIKMGTGILFVGSVKKHTKYEAGQTQLFLFPDTATLGLADSVKEKSSKKLSVQMLVNNNNTRLNYGPASFDSTNSTLYFCMSGGIKHRKQINRLHIYIGTYKNGRLTDTRAFVHNSAEYSTFHPAISPDGTRLYFISDRPGGYGGLDIYVSVKQEDGTWGEPINLGPGVNTSGNEMFPYADRQGALYYSSDGNKGLGALDIYMVSLENDQVLTTPRNLGEGLNSGGDDFGIIMDANGRSGYLSSNRSGIDRIYHFSLDKRIDTLRQGRLQEDTVVQELNKGEKDILFTGTDAVTIREQQKVAIDRKQANTEKEYSDSAKAASAISNNTLLHQDKLLQGKGISDTMKQQEGYQLFSVFFDKDAVAAITETDLQMYRDAVKALLANDSFTIVLRSYTDYAGSEKVNKRVAEKRALTVKRMLEKMGVPASKIIIMPFKPTINILPPSSSGPYSKQAEKNNRRTDIFVTRDSQLLPEEKATAKKDWWLGKEGSGAMVVTSSKAIGNGIHDQQVVVTDKNVKKGNNNKIIDKPVLLNNAKDLAPSIQQRKKQDTLIKTDKIVVTPRGSKNEHQSLNETITNQRQTSVQRNYNLKDSIRIADNESEGTKKPIIIETYSDSLLIELYDNGVADTDTISLIYNDQLLVNRQELSVNQPISFYILVDRDPSKNKMIFFANNLGLIPPNSALMVIKDASGYRKEVFIENKLYQTSVVYFIKKERPVAPKKQ